MIRYFRDAHYKAENCHIQKKKTSRKNALDIIELSNHRILNKAFYYNELFKTIIELDSDGNSSHKNGLAF